MSPAKTLNTNLVALGFGIETLEELREDVEMRNDEDEEPFGSRGSQGKTESQESHVEKNRR